MALVAQQEYKHCFVACDQQKIDSGLCSCINRTMTETIEQAAERLKIEWRIDRPQDFIEGAKWQSSQPNPHRIRTWHLRKLEWMLRDEQISYSRMVEILNEIASGKHKERIEI
jgi:hypothetical protein